MLANMVRDHATNPSLVPAPPVPQVSSTSIPGIFSGNRKPSFNL